MAESVEKPIGVTARPTRPQEFYDSVKRKFANFEGEFQRRQDGNYNGGFFQYCKHLTEVHARMEEHFVFIGK